MQVHIEPPTSQRWYVAVLYVDLCDSTELAGKLEAEVYAELLGALKGLYLSTVEKHNGTLLQLHGDGILAMFGFPAAGEEDVRLAVNAALDLHGQIANLNPQLAELEELNWTLRLHSGVHAGLVVVEQGDIYAGSFQLRSEVTNICARLSAAAGAGEILVSEESLRGCEPFFECGPVRALHLKGVQDALDVVPVLARSKVATRYQARRQRSRLPFVGRASEQDALAEHLVGAREGTLQIVSVVGAPGVGKTRLLDEFTRTIGPGMLLRGSCESLVSARPFEPFINMLRGLQAAPSQLTVRLSLHQELLQSLDDHSASSDKKRFADLILEYLREVVSTQPLVLFIDDWQWVDGASRQLLQSVAMFHDWPLLVLLSARSLEPVDSRMLNPMTVLHLDGLSTVEADYAVKLLLPHIDPFIAQKIGALCGGNPLFLEEICHSDLADKLDHAPSSVEHVPQWLYTVVQARVADLDSGARYVVQVAAVIGTKVPLWLLQRVAGMEEQNDLAELSAADLLLPSNGSGEWCFKHGLIREIVYDLVGLRTRRGLHHSIARVLEDAQDGNDEHVEALAYHYHGAALFAQAVQYAVAAGDKAMTVPALNIARVQYRLAISCLDRGEIDEDRYRQIFAMVRRLNAVDMLDPNPEELPVLERILDLAQRFKDNAGLALCNYWIGTAYYGLGQPRRALTYHYRARTLAQEVGREGLVRETTCVLGQAKAANCEHDAALLLIEQGVRAYGQVEPGTSKAMSCAYSLGCQAMLLGDQGDADAAEQSLERALVLGGGGGHPAVVNILAKGILLEVWRENWSAVVAQADALGSQAETIGNFYIFAMSRMLHRYGQWHLIPRSEAEHSVLLVSEMQETTDWLENFGKGQFLSLNYAWLCEVYLAGNDIPQLRRFAARAIWRSRSGDGFGLAAAYRSLAVAAARCDGQRWKHSAADYLSFARRSAEQRNSAREQLLNDRCQRKIAS